MKKSIFCPATYLGGDAKQTFLTAAGVFFGIWLFYIGLGKWIGGIGGFVAYIEADFANTWVPGWMSTALGYIIAIFEPLLGLWLISGCCPRMAWFGTAKLLFFLVMGKTILQDYATVSDNWLYCIFALTCSALSPPCEGPFEKCVAGSCKEK